MHANRPERDRPAALSLTPSDSTQVFADAAAYTASLPEESSLDREGCGAMVEPGVFITRVLDRLERPWRAILLARALSRASFGSGQAMDLLCPPSQTTVRWREQFGRMLIEALLWGGLSLRRTAARFPMSLLMRGSSSGKVTNGLDARPGRTPRRHRTARAAVSPRPADGR
jgi:hypothetical protein